MNFDNLEERDNKLLGRKEIKFSIKHEKAATPKKQDMIKELAAKYSVSEEQVGIDYIFTRKGMTTSDVKVKIYKEKPKVVVKKANETKGEEKSEGQKS